MNFATRRLYAGVLVMAAQPLERRAVESAAAAKLLADLRARADLAARVAYAAAVHDLVASLGADQLKAIGGDSEPWIAFTSAGPGHPVPAVELLRPAKNADAEETSLWSVFWAWTSPGQMISMITDGEIPDNELKELSKSVTTTIASTAVAGLSAAAEVVTTVGSFSVGKLAIGVAVGVGGYLYFKRRKKGS